MNRLPSKEVDPANRDQNLNEVVCILHSANTLSKGMNPTILPPVMCK